MSGWPDGLTSAELLACLAAEHPAFRSGAELDRIDPAGLSAGERIDLLVVLEEQRRWFEAAQLRTLATIQANDDSGLGLGQEGVSRDQQRAGLFVDAMLSGLPLDALPRVQGRRPAINVVVSADTVLGLDHQPGHLTGYGPITAQTARRLAADQSGTWRRLLTDPDTGALLDISKRPLPATPTAPRLPQRPRRRLCLSDLPATRLPLRTGPRRPVRSGRTDHPGQPDKSLSRPLVGDGQHRRHWSYL
jgi:hypothetical protein